MFLHALSWLVVTSERSSTAIICLGRTCADERTILRACGDDLTILRACADERTILRAFGDERTILRACGDERTILRACGDEKTILRARGDERTILRYAETANRFYYQGKDSITFMHEHFHIRWISIIYVAATSEITRCLL